MRGVLFFLIVPSCYIFSLPLFVMVHCIKLFNPKLSFEIAFKYHKFISNVTLLISGATFDIEGLEHLKQDVPAIYVCNHRSMLDITVIDKYMYKNLVYVGKKSLASWPLAGWWMQATDAIFFNRDSLREGARVIKDLIAKIENGQSIALFPEGTRSKTEGILPFKPGVFKVAQRTGAPIIPMAIKGTDDVFENNKANLKAEKITFRIGKPIYVKDLSKESQKDISNIVRDEIVKMYESM